MQKGVKPLLPPKPSSSIFRLKENNCVDNSFPVDIIVTENGKSDSCGNLCQSVDDRSAAMSASCSELNETERETNCSPKAKPRRENPPCPAPKPKSRSKNKINASETQNNLSGSSDRLDSESSSVNSVPESVGSEAPADGVTTSTPSAADTGSKSEQKNGLPVKPPRPKKEKKLTVGSSSQATREIPSSLEPNDNSVVNEKPRNPADASHKTKPKLYVKTDLVEDETKRLSTSSDSGRLFRSPSYEKALEDNMLGLGSTVQVLNSDDEAFPKRTRSISSNLSDASDGYEDMDSNSLHICRTEPSRSKQEVDGASETDVQTVNGLGSICILPTRTAPPPPSKPKAPLMEIKKKNKYEKNATSGSVSSPGTTGVNPDLEKIIPPAGVKEKPEVLSKNQSKNKPNNSAVSFKNVNNQPNVKRSSSDSVKKLHSKGKQAAKSETNARSRKEKDQCKSVFYCNMEFAESIGQDAAAETKKQHRHSDAYLVPICHELDSYSKDTSSQSDQFYENVDSLSKSPASRSPRSPSALDVMIPLMTTATDESSNMYSEISDLDEKIPIQSALVDDEGYSMINEGKECDEGDVDADYIYPDNWVNGSPKNPSSSDRDVYYNDVGNSEEVFVSPNADDAEISRRVVRERQLAESQYMYDTPQSNPVSCDGDVSSPVSSNMSRSSSGLSIDAAQSENSSSSQLGSEKKARPRQSKSKAFLTAQEILTSEKTFVDVLRLLSQDFIAAMNSAGTALGRPVIAPSVLNQIIKYLPELLKFNEELLEDLNLRIQKWEQNPRIADIFVKKGPFLKLYTNYIREFNSMVALLDDTRRKNPDFDQAVTEFESVRCAKLALKHYMLKPIQRIPQYRMLLSEYQKQLSLDSPDYKDAGTAILIVHDVAEHANQSMKYGDHLNRLLGIQDSLIGQFEVVTPGRTLIKDGILMKFSRKEMQPRMFYLFSDVLLYTTPVAGGYKVNNAIPLGTVKVSNTMKEDFQNEFSIISTQRSFTVSARTEQEKMEWLAAMEEAIANIQLRRHSYCQGKLNSPSIVSIDFDAMDFKLGTKAPVWIPDDRVSMCMICKDEFSLWFRRHHCRGCGKVVCNKCSGYEAPLRYLQYKTDRVCKECYYALNKVVDEMDDLVPDSVGASPGDLPGDVKFTKRSIKSQFRSFALEAPTPKVGQRPAVLQEVNASDDSAEMSGYLHLWKDRKWKKTWFVLKKKVLYTFKASEDAAAEKSVPLLGFEVAPFETYFQGVEPNLIFELMHRGMPSVIFKTESPQSRDKWMLAMRDATMP